MLFLAIISSAYLREGSQKILKGEGRLHLQEVPATNYNCSISPIHSSYSQTFSGKFDLLVTLLDQTVFTMETI